MALDLSSLEKAVHSLDRAIKVASTMIKGEADADQKEVIRAGVIQNFEFTYELCWKFMKRWLEANINGQAVDGLTIKELFRVAAEHRLIKDTSAWFDYHQKRNQTSHAYNEAVAEDVYNSAVLFINDAKDFLKTLKAKND